MRHRTSVSRCVIALALLLPLTASTAAQDQGEQTMPRTAWGDPDLQGVWDFRTLTPLERPDELSEQQVFASEEAAAAFAAATVHALDADRRDGADQAFGFGSDIERAYNNFWMDFGNDLTEDRRTSLIVDPPDGKIPWTPEGRERPGTFDEAFSGMVTAGPEDRAPTSCARRTSTAPAPICTSWNASRASATTRCCTSSRRRIRPPTPAPGPRRSRCAGPTAISTNTPATKGTTACSTCWPARGPRSGQRRRAGARSSRGATYVNRTAKKMSTVPRHNDINGELARKICKDLLETREEPCADCECC